VQPGADPSQIRLAYRGASGVRLTPDGQLEVSTPLIRFSDAAPVAYQEQAGQRAPVAMSYALQASPSGGPAASYGYSFHLGAYDHSQPVILDPTVLVYAGYIGGADLDSGSGIAVDNNGNAYITGLTQSPGTFPAKVGPDLTFHGGEDAFVAKVNASGTALDYAGYLGGTGNDEGNSIAVDGAGNAYVTGVTSSSDFPVSGGLSHTYGGGASDAFVAKVSADGTHLVYSGYIGGAAKDVGNSIAVDVNGNAYVAGFTLSSQTTFPVKGGPDLTYGGGTDFGDAFVAEVSADGSGLVYSGYIGGAGDDSGNAITVDGSGNAFVAGFTNSHEDTFPVKGGPSLTFAGGGGDGFVAEVAAGGGSLVFCGFIGGSGTDSAKGIALDAGNIYVAGQTDSTNLPVKVGPSLTYGGGVSDAFVARVHAGGASLDYAGYIGGSGTDEGLGIVVDNIGDAYVSGSTNSTESSFPVVGGPSLHYGGGSDDAFVAKVNASGSALIYAGYIGGAGIDIGGGIALGQAGSVYLTGQTFSDQSTFPATTGPYLTYGGNGDAFVAKVSSFVPNHFVYLPLVMR